MGLPCAREQYARTETRPACLGRLAPRVARVGINHGNTLARESLFGHTVSKE